MEAQVQDFLSGMLRDCADHAADWRRRHPVGADWRLARLSVWSLLAHRLPEKLDSPNGPPIDLDTAHYRLMWSEARAMRLLAHAKRPTAPLLPNLLESLYQMAAQRSDPPHCFKDEAAREDLCQWGDRQLAIAEPSLPQAAMAFLDFLRTDALNARTDQMGALLATALPAWTGGPAIAALGPEARLEEGYDHALDAAQEGEESAWIAFYLARARKYLKRMPAIWSGSETIRKRWENLFSRAPFGAEVAEKLAAELVALPIVTPSFLADTGIEGDHLRDALVLLVAADEASEVFLDGAGFTVLPAPLRLLL